MKRHIQRIHKKGILHANQKAYANQASQHAYTDQATDPEVPAVDTVADVDTTVTAVDTTTDVKPLDDCPTSLDQYIRSITRDHSVSAIAAFTKRIEKLFANRSETL